MGQAEQERQSGTGRAEKTERDSHNRKDRTGLSEQDFLSCTLLKKICCVTVFSVTNMFGDIYCFETVLLCDMYHLRIYHLITCC